MRFRAQYWDSFSFKWRADIDACRSCSRGIGHWSYGEAEKCLDKSVRSRVKGTWLSGKYRSTNPGNRSNSAGGTGAGSASGGGASSTGAAGQGTGTGMIRYCARCQCGSTVNFAIATNQVKASLMFSEPFSQWAICPKCLTGPWAMLDVWPEKDQPVPLENQYRGAVRGIRVWVLRDYKQDPPRLGALTTGHNWKPGWNDDPEYAAGGSRGFYAFNSWDELYAQEPSAVIQPARLADARSEYIIGTILCKGRMMACENGVRASSAKPEYLVIHTNDPIWKKKAEEISRHYGMPMIFPADVRELKMGLVPYKEEK